MFLRPKIGFRNGEFVIATGQFPLAASHFPAQVSGTVSLKGIRGQVRLPPVRDGEIHAIRQPVLSAIPLAKLVVVGFKPVAVQAELDDWVLEVLLPVALGPVDGQKRRSWRREFVFLLPGRNLLFWKFSSSALHMAARTG